MGSEMCIRDSLYYYLRMQLILFNGSERRSPIIPQAATVVAPGGKKASRVTPPTERYQHSIYPPILTNLATPMHYPHKSLVICKFVRSETANWDKTGAPCVTTPALSIWHRLPIDSFRHSSHRFQPTSLLQSILCKSIW